MFYTLFFANEKELKSELSECVYFDNLNVRVTLTGCIWLYNTLIPLIPGFRICLGHQDWLWLALMALYKCVYVTYSALFYNTLCSNTTQCLSGSNYVSSAIKSFELNWEREWEKVPWKNNVMSCDLPHLLVEKLCGSFERHMDLVPGPETSGIDV